MSETPASAVQIGGNHYKDMAIQPSEFIQRNGLNWCEGNVIKYVARHRSKNGAQDLQKARHYIDLLLEWEYALHQSPPAHPYLHKSELTREEARELADKIAPIMACNSCLRQDCTISKVPVEVCAYHLPPAGTMPMWPKQETPADEWAEKDLCRRCGAKCDFAGGEHTVAECEDHIPSPSPISLALPTITVPGDLEEVRKKYEEEYDEWCMATEDLARLIEAWDVAQVLQTLAERGEDVLKFNNPAVHCLQIRHKEEPEWVEAAKRGMVIKNAARAMYAPEVNSKIIMSAGREW